MNRSILLAIALSVPVFYALLRGDFLDRFICRDCSLRHSHAAQLAIPPGTSAEEGFRRLSSRHQVRCRPNTSSAITPYRVTGVMCRLRASFPSVIGALHW